MKKAIFKVNPNGSYVEVVDFILDLIAKEKTIFLLNGDLGAGKTHLVKKIIEKIDPSHDNDVVSPTFSIVNLYQVNSKNIYHLDLYRIKKIEEIYELDIYSILDNNLVFIEWPDIGTDIFRKFKCTSISIDADLDQSRIITIDN